MSGSDVGNGLKSRRQANPSTALRSLNDGRGLHSEKFSHYEEMQPETEKKIVTEYQQARANGSHATNRG